MNTLNDTLNDFVNDIVNCTKADETITPYGGMVNVHIFSEELKNRIIDEYVERIKNELNVEKYLKQNEKN